MALQTVHREHPQASALLDEILAVHKAHPSNYFSSACKLCMANACYHIQQEDKFAERCQVMIRDIPADDIDAAIHDVNTALGERLVQPRGVGNE